MIIYIVTEYSYVLYYKVSINIIYFSDSQNMELNNTLYTY